MQFKAMHKPAWLAVGVAILFSSVPLIFSPQKSVGTTEYMLRLPAYGKFKCALCHTSSKPIVGAADLNVFGKDFRSNGNTWDRTLAQMNSDGDRCPNGFELNDANGDGILDDPTTNENSNPGDPDCSISLTKETWGIIKEIFSGP